MSDLTIEQLRELGGYVAARAEIQEVRPTRLLAQLESGYQGGQLSYQLRPELTVTFDEGARSLVVQAAYLVRIRQELDVEAAKDPSELSEDFLAVLELVFTGTFGLELDEGDRDPTNDEIEAFAKSTALFAIHPYVREAVADLSGRLGLPPLTLGVLRIGTQGHSK